MAHGDFIYDPPLNEAYMKYYGKNDTPLFFPYKLNESLNFHVDDNDLIEVENGTDLHDLFCPCINFKYSLTNFIRDNEANSYFESEQQIEVINTRETLKRWIDLCKEKLGKTLCNLTFEDVHLKMKGVDPSSKIIENINFNAKDEHDGIISTFQFMFPFSRKDIKSKDYIDFLSYATNEMKKNGYNIVKAQNVVPKRTDAKYAIVLVQFEAIYAS